MSSWLWADWPAVCDQGRGALDLSIVRAGVIGGPLGLAGARWLGRGIPAAVVDRMAAFEALRGGLLLPPAPHRSPAGTQAPAAAAVLGSRADSPRRTPTQAEALRPLALD